MLNDSDLEYREVAAGRINSLFFSRWRGEDQEYPDNFEISDESIRLVVATLRTAAKDENKEIRGKAIESLCLIDKTRGAPVLMAALEEFINVALDENYQVKKDPWDFDLFQGSLHHAIIILNDKSFCEPVTRLLDSKSWDVKIDAAETLLHLGDERGRKILLDTLVDGDWVFRVRAATILFKYGDKRGWDVLARGLSDDDEDLWFVKNGIVETLARSGDPRAVDVFINLLNIEKAHSICDTVIGDIISSLGALGAVRAIEAIKKWQYIELVNCDDDIVEKALKNITRT